MGLGNMAPVDLAVFALEEQKVINLGLRNRYMLPFLGDTDICKGGHDSGVSCSRGDSGVDVLAVVEKVMRRTNIFSEVG